jgi:Na+-driven multidrug efflux pump
LGVGASTFGTTLLHLYSSDEAVIAAGMARLAVICRLYFLCGCMDVLAGCMRGLGYSVLPMIVSLVGSCALRLLWIATVFQMFRSTTTLYISYPLSWALTLLTHLLCFAIVRHKMKKQQPAPLKQAA